MIIRNIIKKIIIMIILKKILKEIREIYLKEILILINKKKGKK
jgi:hypothetical protein